MSSLIQEFLNNRLIDIGESDEQLSKLERAAADIAKHLKSKRTDIPYYTLVALDPEIPEDEPRIKGAFSILTKHWKTAPAKYPGLPRTELRAIIAEALRQTCNDKAGASIVWLTALSYAPHAALGKERPIWESLLSAAGKKAEAAAVEFWGDGAAITEEIDIPSPAITPVSVKVPKIDQATLAQHLRAAAGNSGGDAGSITRNSTWPHGQSGVWADQFGTIASLGIATEINKLTEGLTRATQGLQEWRAPLEEFAKQLAEAVKQAVSPIRPSALRSHLLWWRAAGYSSLTNTGYEKIDESIRPLTMAIDLHRQVPPFCPYSVEFFLAGSIRRHQSNAAEGLSIEEHIEGIKDKAIPAILQALGSSKSAEGRITLLDYIRLAPSEGSQVAPVQAALGLDQGTLLTRVELGTWLFRDLQAKRIAATK